MSWEGQGLKAAEREREQWETLADKLGVENRTLKYDLQIARRQLLQAREDLANAGDWIGDYRATLTAIGDSVQATLAEFPR